MNNGNQNNNNKNNNNYYVRPVLAYLVKMFNEGNAGIFPMFTIEKSEQFFLSKKGRRQCKLLCFYGRLILEGWSSTENNNNNAWKLHMNNGNQNNNNKNNNNYVRPVLAYLIKNIYE